MKRGLLVLACAIAAQANATYQLQGLGANFMVFGVSGDGNSPVGSSDGGYSVTSACSFDGGVRVGWQPNGSGGFVAVRNSTPLGYLAGYSQTSLAYGVSADGTVVAGECRELGTGNPISFRWTSAGGMVSLGTLPNTGWNRVYAVSGDGQAAVGTSDGAFGAGSVAFRWMSSTGLANLGDLPGGDVNAAATACSFDGNVVVGKSSGTNGMEAFRWTPATGMLGLGDIVGGDFGSRAFGVSYDGNVIVGSGRAVDNTNTSYYAAFVWHPLTGIVDLKALLTAHGVNTTGWRLESAVGVSADGTVIVGTGYNPAGQPESWLARIELPSSQVVTPSSYSIASGYEADGTLGSLYYSDDNRLSVFGDDLTLAAEVNINATSPTANPSLLTFALEASAARSGLAQTVRLRNYALGTYVVVDGRVATGDDSSFEATFTTTAADYIGPSRAMRARVSWSPINDEAPSQDGWVHCIDLARWVVHS